MKQKEIVPIVFATDDGYAPYLGVALHSLIQYSNCEHEYKVFILYTEMSEEHQRRLLAMACGHVTIEMVNVSDKVKGLENYTTNDHFTVAATYRFLIAEIFEKYPKILYLDCDIMILDDVYQLFSFDIGDHILGVAQFAISQEIALKIKNVLKIPLKSAFNSGVLLINTKAFIEEKVKEKSFALLQEDWKRKNPQYTAPDQDALILTCLGKTATFPMNWNFRWTKEIPEKMSYDLLPEFALEYEKAKKDVKIIHFVTKWKPWNSPELKYSDIFWLHARQTIFYEEILIKETRVKKEKIPYQFPWKQIEPGSVVVIYGAGAVGKSYVSQILMTSYCHISAICDQNAKNMRDQVFPIVTKEELSLVQYDYIVIAIAQEEVADKIRTALIAQGIEPEAIKWKE